MSRFHPTPLFAAVLAALALSACGDKKPDAQAQAAPPPPEVAVVKVAPQRVGITSELPGRIEAVRVAQVRARVPGIVQKRVFVEGSEVKAGDVLFRIDPAPLQAVLSSAEATRARAEANVAQANLKVQRYKPLVETNAISRQEYDDALAAQKQTQADLQSAKASVQTATLNLGYATVTAPISGRIGRAQVTEGALVGQGEATPLAMIQQIDPIYVNLTQSATEMMALRRAMDAGKLQSVGPNQAKISIVTDDGQVYAQTGKLLFSDVAVDPSSGAITLRAEFPNPKRLLLPGMYVRARLEQAVDQSAIMVPQQAVLRDNNGASVMTVGADGKVAPRPIKTGDAQGNNWIVTDGLNAGDTVIVEGLQKVKPGAPVKTTQWNANAPAGNAPAGVAQANPQK
ncbi:efflux RND transporter periplasmic adaptor subunit [Noviherbaspirillum pedocola]|uniref:Efflux RND transporter periplasmic adaptor subunit n=1 Tax=Noviherbaspirillum pedocola TaxID=2801341 RepID=A0A934SQP1_9BURK|nr:efflux RND transporter periplasmic adaptor subunit [Noviherbaspirillum pedocola]MBK4733356.1 efflux RND transporter periplasmic adaptor subunit [Noviherbaspirillum pedocola]